MMIKYMGEETFKYSAEISLAHSFHIISGIRLGPALKVQSLIDRLLGVNRRVQH